MRIRRWSALAAAVVLVASCTGGGGASSSSSSGSSGAPGTSSTAPSGASGSGGDTAACDPSTFKTVKPGVLTVATYGTGVPDLIVNPDKTLGGLEGALFNQFVRECGLKMQLFETTFASMILAVKNREADVGTYIFWNPDRSKQVYYSWPHWIADVTNVFTRADFPYTDAASLDGKKVGTVVGFVWAPFLQKTLGGNAALFPDAVEGGTALLQGQIDGFINGSSTINNPPFDKAQGKVKGHEFKAGDFGIPADIVTNKSYRIVACDNKGLAAALNQSLKRMVDSGAYAQVMTENKVPANEAPELKDPQQGC